MSNWLAYDDFVDLVRNHHHDGFTGLITGVSDNQHSFQIGFRAGQIILLTYRIFKGSAALEKLIHIEKAKISEHANTEVPTSNAELPETSSILSRLTLEDITAGMMPQRSRAVATAERPAARNSSARRTRLDINQIKTIKASAVHHFGPIGAMVCEELLADENLSSNDLNTLLQRIAEEVGADNSDTQAFLSSAS